MFSLGVHVVIAISLTLMRMRLPVDDPKFEQLTHFWKGQFKAFKNRVQGNYKANRFDPVTLRMALAVHMRSGSAYNVLRTMLPGLPADRTIRQYFEAASQPPGCGPHAFQYAVEKASLYGIDLRTRTLRGVLMFDEVLQRPHTHIH